MQGIKMTIKTRDTFSQPDFRIVRATTVGYAHGLAQKHTVQNWEWEKKLGRVYKIKQSDHPEWIVAHPSEQGNV